MDKHANTPTPAPDKVPPYESRQIHLKPILIAAMVLIIVGLVVQVLIWTEFGILDTRQKVRDPQVSPLLPARQIPPGPHLEARRPAYSDPATEPFTTRALSTSRSDEKTMLDSYSCEDEQNGVVRIPIEEAMKKVVEREAQKQQQSSGSGSQTQTAGD